MKPATGKELEFIDWLIDIGYPFNMTFDPRPPVNHKRLAMRWNTRDFWGVSDEDAMLGIEDAISGSTQANE